MAAANVLLNVGLLSLWGKHVVRIFQTKVKKKFAWSLPSIRTHFSMEIDGVYDAGWSSLSVLHLNVEGIIKPS